MNGEKLEELLLTCTAEPTPLPGDIELEGVDVRYLQLPFPPQAFLPTMRLVFAAMENKVRFALTDHQINNITTGIMNQPSRLMSGYDFVKQLLNPIQQDPNTNAPTYLYTQLTQIQFPPNVTLLPDRQLEKRNKQRLTILKSVQARAEQAKKERELLEALKKEEQRERIVRWRQSVNAAKKFEKRQEGVMEEAMKEKL